MQEVVNFNQSAEAVQAVGRVEDIVPQAVLGLIDEADFVERAGAGPLQRRAVGLRGGGDLVGEIDVEDGG